MSTKTLEQQKIDFPEEPTEENSKTKGNLKILIFLNDMKLKTNN